MTFSKQQLDKGCQSYRWKYYKIKYLYTGQKYCLRSMKRQSIQHLNRRKWKSTYFSHWMDGISAFFAIFQYRPLRDDVVVIRNFPFYSKFEVFCVHLIWNEKYVNTFFIKKTASLWKKLSFWTVKFKIHISTSPKNRVWHTECSNLFST